MTNGFEEKYKDENPFNLHYLIDETKEYGNNSEFEATTTVSEDATVRTAFLAGNRDENSLTNKVFFDRHHGLNKNERLKPHQKELINEWLYIRNNLVRPIMVDLKSKTKESTKYSQPTLDKLLGSLPEPMKLPSENAVEFAPEPVGTAHWPVRPIRTEDKDWHVVSYRFGPGRNDFVRGRNTAREFYASRGVDRLHAAIDLYGNAGDEVIAIQDGIFLYAIENFLGNTSAMYIQHTIEQPNVIFVYGEIEKYSWRTFNLKIGDKVKAGQVIAKLGITPGGSSMLHCETWGLGITGIKNRLHSSFRSWKKGAEPPKYVLNPTKYLLAVRKQELEKRKQQQNSASTTYKSTFNESLVPPESESFLGSVFSDVRGRLMWGKEYDTVSSAYRVGNTDENSLTNIIFFDRHQDRKNQPIQKHEKKEAREWIDIRDKIVRPIIAELKKQSQSVPTSTGQPLDKSVDLPLVLAGPIVRRATKNSVWFWIALSEKVIGIYTIMFRYDNEGKILNKIPLVRPTTINKQLGKNFWVALFEVNPLEGSFPTDTIIGYDVEFQFYNKKPEYIKLSDLKLPIQYIPFQLPTLIIGEKNTTIAHGSCRRPGSGNTDYPDSMKDAFGVFDDWMYEKRKLVYERPASLILTGDQIYADDVALPLFDAIKKLSYDIFGYNEEINFNGKFIPTNQISSKPSINVTCLDKNEKWSRRKQLTHYSTSQFGFSTDDGEAHLLSFEEYASMYLLVWSKELWDKYCIRDDEIKKRIIHDYPTLWDYSLYVGACRRVMANCATYMIFDDHDVTDDWNLDQLWETTTKSTQPGRQIIANALTAFMIFQGWGNDPETFDETFKQSMLNHLNDLMINNGKPGNNAESFYNTILSRHWSFMAASNPKALCVDTRTLREFPVALNPPDRKCKEYDSEYSTIVFKLYVGMKYKFERPAEGQSAILIGHKAIPKLNELLVKHKFAKNSVLLMVLPTPFFGHPFHLYAQEATYPYPSARYPGDWEQFDNNTSQRASLINWLKEYFNPSALVILSGDVHYSSVIYGGYAFAQSLDDAKNKNFKWKFPVIQITSSPIKNVKQVLKKAVEKYGGSLGVLTETISPESRSRYSFGRNGSFIGLGMNTAELSGELGKDTLVHQNNICVVTMPQAPEFQVKSLFIGVKNGKLATAKTSIHVDNTDFMKPIMEIVDPTYFGILKRKLSNILLP